MRPDLDELLASIRRALVEFVAPEVSSVYARTELTYALSLLAALSRETPDAAAELMAENAALRRLLGESGSRLRDCGLDAALLREIETASSAAGPTDITLPALRAEGAALFDLLVRLQAACEDSDGGTPEIEAVYRETIMFLAQRAERQAGGRR